MGNQKRKWERLYEEYSSSTILDEQIAELEEKLNHKPTKKEDYDKHQKLTAIKSNLPKVKNILEKKEQLEAEISEIQAELEKRESIDEFGKECEQKEAEKRKELIEPFEERKQQLEQQKADLENEMTGLQAEYEDLQKQLKQPNLDDNQRKSINEKLDQNQAKRQENNKKFIKCQDEYTENEGLLEKNKIEFQKYKAQLMEESHEKSGANQTVMIDQLPFLLISSEDLKNRIAQLQMNIGRCKVACIKLMEGKSWDDVEVALDEYDARKLTAKGEQAKKMQQNRTAAKAENAKGEQSAEQPKEPVQPEGEAKKPETEAAKPQSEAQKPETEAAKPEGEAKKPEAGQAKPEGEAKKSEAGQAQQQTEAKEEENTSLAVPENEKTIIAKIMALLKKIVDKMRGKSNEIVEEEGKTEETLFSKIGSKVKAGFDKVKEWVTGKGETEVEEEIENEVEQPETEQPEAEQPKAEKPEAEQPKTEQQTKRDSFREYLKFVAENGANISPEEKAKEEQISKTVERLVEERRKVAEKEGRPFDEEAARKTAKAVAENSYKRKNPATQENDGNER